MRTVLLSCLTLMKVDSCIICWCLSGISTPSRSWRESLLHSPTFPKDTVHPLYPIVGTATPVPQHFITANTLCWSFQTYNPIWNTLMNFAPSVQMVFSTWCQWGASKPTRRSSSWWASPTPPHSWTPRTRTLPLLSTKLSRPVLIPSIEARPRRLLVLNLSQMPIEITTMLLLLIFPLASLRSTRQMTIVHRPDEQSHCLQ